MSLHLKKYLFTPRYFIFIQSQVLLNPHCSVQSHGSSQRSVVWITSWVENRKWSHLPTQPGSHSQVKQRNVLLLTPPPRIPPCCCSWPGVGEYGLKQACKACSQHGFMPWKQALDVPPTVQSLEVKDSMIYGQSDTVSLKDLPLSVTSCSSLCTQEGMKLEERCVFSISEELPAGLAKHLRCDTSALC